MRLLIDHASTERGDARLALQRTIGNRAVQRVLAVQRNGVVVTEAPDEEQPVVKNADAEEIDLTPPHPAPYPDMTPGGALSYPAPAPTLTEEQRQRNAARVRERQAADQASMPTLPVLYAGAAAGPALDEATAAAQWNQADLAPLEVDVALASAQHSTWSTALASAQASMPRVTTFLDPAVPNRLASLATACTNFTQAVAGQRAAPTVAGFHAVRALHNRVRTEVADPTLVSTFGPAETLATIGAAFLALPAGVRTAIEAAGDPVLRILTRLPAGDIAAISGVPPEVIDLWDIKGAGEITGCISNAGSLAAQAGACRTAFTALGTNTPSITDFPEAMCASTKNECASHCASC